MKPGMEGSDVIKMATQWLPNAALLPRTTSNYPQARHHLKIQDVGIGLKHPPSPRNTETEKGLH